MNIERNAVEDLIERLDDAISGRNIPLARELKSDLSAVIEAAHAEALETNDEKLTSAIHEYESLCDSSRAQGREAKALFSYIQSAIQYRGLEYCTLTLAKFGSKRSLNYIRRGLVDGYTVNEAGRIVSLPLPALAEAEVQAQQQSLPSEPEPTAPVAGKSTPVIKIDFKDDGQDFTRWYIRAGRVVDCEPFQARIWLNTVLTMKPRVGVCPRILTRFGDYTVLNHTVESVTELDEAQSAEVMARYRDMMREELGDL